MQEREEFPGRKLNSAMAMTRVDCVNVMSCGKRMLFLETESAGPCLCRWWESLVGCKQEEVKQRAVGRFGRRRVFQVAERCVDQPPAASPPSSCRYQRGCYDVAGDPESRQKSCNDDRVL